MTKKANNIGNLWERFNQETGELAGINSELYIKWLENQIVDPEYQNPNVPNKKDWRYYSEPEIQSEYNALPDKEQKEVLWEAMDYMQQHNGRSRFTCLALAMGYENYEGEYDTFFKRGKKPD